MLRGAKNLHLFFLQRLRPRKQSQDIVKNLNKCIIGSFLLAIIFFQTTGYLIVYKLWEIDVRNNVKHRVIEGIPDDELSVIKIPLMSQDPRNDNFEIEENDEFRFNDEMYDIVRTEIHNDTAWYYAFCDREETKMLASLSSSIAKHIEDDPATNRQSTQFFDFSQILYVLSNSTEQCAANKNIEYYLHDSTFVPDLHYTVITPPPKS